MFQCLIQGIKVYVLFFKKFVLFIQSSYFVLKFTNFQCQFCVLCVHSDHFVLVVLIKSLLKCWKYFFWTWSSWVWTNTLWFKRGTESFLRWSSLVSIRVRWRYVSIVNRPELSLSKNTWFLKLFFFLLCWNDFLNIFNGFSKWKLSTFLWYRG